MCWFSRADRIVATHSKFAIALSPRPRQVIDVTREELREERRGAAAPGAGHDLGRPLRDHRPPSSPAPGPMSITQSLAATTRMSCSTTMTVLPGVDQAVELRHEPLDVGRMQAGGGLVEDVERVRRAGRAAARSRA